MADSWQDTSIQQVPNVDDVDFNTTSNPSHRPTESRNTFIPISVQHPTDAIVPTGENEEEDIAPPSNVSVTSQELVYPALGSTHDGQQTSGDRPQEGFGKADIVPTSDDSAVLQQTDHCIPYRDDSVTSPNQAASTVSAAFISDELGRRTGKDSPLHSGGWEIDPLHVQVKTGFIPVSTMTASCEETASKELNRDHMGTKGTERRQSPIHVVLHVPQEPTEIPQEPVVLTQETTKILQEHLHVVSPQEPIVLPNDATEIPQQHVHVVVPQESVILPPGPVVLPQEPEILPQEPVISPEKLQEEYVPRERAERCLLQKHAELPEQSSELSRDLVQTPQKRMAQELTELPRPAGEMPQAATALHVPQIPGKLPEDVAEIQPTLISNSAHKPSELSPKELNDTCMSQEPNELKVSIDTNTEKPMESTCQLQTIEKPTVQVTDEELDSLYVSTKGILEPADGVIEMSKNSVEAADKKVDSLHITMESILKQQELNIETAETQQPPGEITQQPVALVHVPMELTEEPIGSIQEPTEASNESVSSSQKNVELTQEMVTETMKSSQETLESSQKPVEYSQEPVKSTQEPMKSSEKDVEFMQETVTETMASSQEILESSQEPVKSIHEPLESVGSTQELLQSSQEPLGPTQETMARVVVQEESEAIAVESRDLCTINQNVQEAKPCLDMKALSEMSASPKDISGQESYPSALGETPALGELQVDAKSDGNNDVASSGDVNEDTMKGDRLPTTSGRSTPNVEGFKMVTGRDSPSVRSVKEDSGRDSPSQRSRRKVRSWDSVVAEANELNLGIFPAENLFEYQWPQEKGAEWYFVQEQISQFLQVKSFKRKYPELERRVMDGKEKDFLREKGIVTEEQVTLGLTALRADEVYDLMLKDAPEKSADYARVLHEKEKQNISNKRKQYEVPSVDSSKVKEYVKKAVRQAADYNTALMAERKEERRYYFDMQTLTVQMPSARMKKHPATKLGPYPVAVIPGQFQNYYRSYTSEELKYFPLNTSLYGPMAPRRQTDLGPPVSLEETESSDSTDSSSDSSDSLRSVTPLDVSQDSLASDVLNETIPLVPQQPVYKPKDIPDAICSLCLKDSTNNKMGMYEKMIHCSQCDNSGHPSCLDMTETMVDVIQTYPWQCMECKTCFHCGDPTHEDKMMFCDMCDRGYHTFCVGLEDIPTGLWACESCQTSDMPATLKPHVPMPPLSPAPGTPPHYSNVDQQSSMPTLQTPATGSGRKRKAATKPTSQGSAKKGRTSTPTPKRTKKNTSKQQLAP